MPHGAGAGRLPPALVARGAAVPTRASAGTPFAATATTQASQTTREATPTSYDFRTSERGGPTRARHRREPLPLLVPRRGLRRRAAALRWRVAEGARISEGIYWLPGTTGPGEQRKPR